MGSMVRLSSQSKSNPDSLVAECKATGMCTNPKLIAPFQITRLVDVSIVDSTALTGCGKRAELQCVRGIGWVVRSLAHQRSCGSILGVTGRQRCCPLQLYRT